MKKAIKYTLVFVWIFISSNIISSQNNTVDSLKTLLKTTKADTTKVRLLSEIGEADNIIRVSFWDSIVNEAQKLNLLPLKAHSLNNIGYIFLTKGDIRNSLNYFGNSLKLSEKIGYTDGTANALLNIGVVYDGQADYNNALEYYNKSLRIIEKTKNEDMLATALNNMAGIYNNQHNYEKALRYYAKSLAIRKKMNDLAGIANSLNNIGNVYYIREDSVNKKQQLDIAINFINQSLAISERIDNKYEAAFSLNVLSDIYFQQKDIDKALAYAQRAMKNAKEIESPESISESAKQLKDIFKKQNKYKDAFEMYQLFIQMRDSISNQETKKASIKQQLKYEYEKKSAADSIRVAKEKEVVAAQLKQEETQRYALYGGLLLTIIFGGFMINRVRITQKQKKLIEEQKNLVEEKQKEILDSIHYAKRIQQSLLPHEKYIDKNLKRLNKNK